MCDYCYNVMAEDAARLSPKGQEHTAWIEAMHLKVFGVPVMDRQIPMTSDEIAAKARHHKAVKKYLATPLP